MLFGAASQALAAILSLRRQVSKYQVGRPLVRSWTALNIKGKSHDIKSYGFVLEKVDFPPSPSPSDATRIYCPNMLLSQFYTPP